MKDRYDNLTFVKFSPFSLAVRVHGTLSANPADIDARCQLFLRASEQMAGMVVGKLEANSRIP